MKRKNRAPSTSATSPDGKKKKMGHENAGESSSTTKSIDFSSPQRVLESLLSLDSLEAFFNEHWEKKPLFVKRGNADFYGSLFSKKDLEGVLKKEEILFTEDMSLLRYAEGKTELLNESGRVNLKHIKAAGVSIQFHQPDRFKDEVWKLLESLETYFTCLVGADAFVFEPGSQGLAPQFDELETFILQLEGKTKWKLFKPLQELPQEASPDLELSDIGEASHEFDMEPGDLLYYPRGIVFFPTPIDEKEHTLYLAITTFQENSWGNMMTSALSRAIEKAMETDVEYRKGLPVNISSFMGTGIKETEETEGQHMNEEEEGEKVKPSNNPRTAFTDGLDKLLKGLVHHLNPDKAVDSMMRDFFAGRLPPFKKESRKGKKKAVAPFDDSKIRLSHPDHVRVLIGDLSDGVPAYYESDEDMSEAEEEDDDEKGSGEEETEESEESEKNDNKKDKKNDKKKTKDKVKTKEKPAKETKGKKKKEVKDEECDQEMEAEGEDEDGGSDKESDAFDNGEAGDEYMLVLHSVKNKRASHMMGDPSPCSTLQFPFRYKDALQQITADRDKFVMVSSLKLPEKERLSLVKSLWDHGLLEIMD